ncbi:hypothetical protein ACN47E_008214 [Coniothyrium glycines]
MEGSETLAKNFAQYIVVKARDAPRDTPKLHLSLSADVRCSRTQPYHIYMTLSRKKDTVSSCVVFEWSRYGHLYNYTSPPFLLLQHKAGGFQKISIDHAALNSHLVDVSRKEPLKINGWNADVYSLAPGASSMTAMFVLPERYHQLLEAGEKYTLLWPGCRIATWDYGNVHSYLNRELFARGSGEDHLALLGGSHVTFTVYEEEIPWPGRAEYEAHCGFKEANSKEQRWRLETFTPKNTLPVKVLERNPDAPHLTVTLSSPSSIARGARFEVAISVKYEAPQDTRAITLHTREFSWPDNIRVFRRVQGQWEEYIDRNRNDGFILVQDEPIPVDVSQHEMFVTLWPGQEWKEFQHWTEGDEGLPYGAADGEVLMLVWVGRTLDWWDWGTKEDHRDTDVRLGGWCAGPVEVPHNNGGRPKLVVPASNVVELTVLSPS